MSDLNGLIKKIEKDHGAGCIARAVDAKAIATKRVSTGLLSLDMALRGGVPLGKIIEVYGPYSGGKTTLCMKIASEFQKAAYEVAWVDAERSFDPEYAKLIGVDIERLLLTQPEDQEGAIDMMAEIIQSRMVGLVVLDSITGLIPTKVIGKSADEPTMGVEAKLNNLFMRKVVASLAPGDLLREENQPWCSLIMINQIRANMSQYGKDTPGGGFGIKFFKHLGLEVRRSEHLGSKGEQVKELKAPKAGQRSFFLVEKNKCGSPFGSGFFDYYFEDGPCRAGQFDVARDVALAALNENLIEKAGSWFMLDTPDEEMKVQGLNGIRAAFNDRPDLIEYYRRKILE